MDRSHWECISGGSFYDIVSVRDCCIVDEDYRRVLACVLDYFYNKTVVIFIRYAMRVI